MPKNMLYKEMTNSFLFIFLLIYAFLIAIQLKDLTAFFSNEKTILESSERIGLAYKKQSISATRVAVMFAVNPNWV